MNRSSSSCLLSLLPSAWRLQSLLVTASLALALSVAPPRLAHAHSTASELSALPVAVSVIAPSAVLSAGAVLTVVAVEASATGTLWVLERASDGARVTLQFSGAVAGGASLLAGTAITVTAVSAGWVLSAAGQAIAFIPNEIGRALTYNERVTR